jgi:hypothetical protein
MAWDELPGDGNEYTGDLPMDAFGGALDQARDAFKKAAGRLPYASELAEAMARALAASPEVTGQDRSEGLLARWRAMPRTAGKKRPRVSAGDIVRIPYAANGARHIYARVLFTPPRSKSDPRRGPGLGVCWVVHDLDAPAVGDIEPAAVRSSPILFGPFHADEAAVHEGRWRIVGHVEPDDADLPTLGVRLGSPPRDVLNDYFGTEIPNTPENIARKGSHSCGSGAGAVRLIRMLRGALRRMTAYEHGMGVRGDR